MANILTYQLYTAYNKVRPVHLRKLLEQKLDFTGITELENLHKEETRISTFVTLSILESTTPAEQFDFFLSVIEQVQNMHNYAAVALIIAGIMDVAVRIPPGYEEVLKAHDHVQDNFARLSKLINMAPSPRIPFLAILLRDLTNICESYPKTERVEGESEPLINLDRYKIINKIFNSFLFDYYRGTSEKNRFTEIIPSPSDLSRYLFYTDTYMSMSTKDRELAIMGKARQSRASIG